MKKAALIVATATGCLLATWGVSHAVTCPSGYSYYRTATIDHTQAGASDSNNFPVLLSTTIASSFATSGNGGKLQNANGYDWVIADNSSGSPLLYYETETYNASTGNIIYWVKVGTLSHTTDTTIYMFYGNSSVTTDQSNKNAVWDGNYYVGVWHLSNGTTLNPNDSTSNANNGIIDFGPPHTTAVPGFIDGGMSGNGDSGDYVRVPSVAGLHQQTFTAEAWINTPTVQEIWLFKNADQLLRIDGPTVSLLRAGVANIVTSAASVSANTWYHLAATYNSSTGAGIIYINGNASGSATNSQTFAFSGDLYFGQASPTNNLIDEERYSSIVRSADWIKTEYNNQISTSTMVTWGAETACGAAAPVTNPFFFGGE